MMRRLIFALVAVFAAASSMSLTLETAVSGPGTVYVEAWGTIVVRGHEEKRVVATLTSTNRGSTEVERDRKPYGIRTSGDRIFVWSDLPGNVSLLVPNETRLVVRSLRWGDVTVSDICGDVEATSYEGGVRLTRIGGAIVAHAGNGPIEAVLAWDRPQPASFTSMHGAITITVPAGLSLRARLKTDGGRVRSAVPWDEAFTLARPAGAEDSPDAGPPHLFAYTRFGTVSIAHGDGDIPPGCAGASE